MYCLFLFCLSLRVSGNVGWLLFTADKGDDKYLYKQIFFSLLYVSDEKNKVIERTYLSRLLFFFFLPTTLRHFFHVFSSLLPFLLILTHPCLTSPVSHCPSISSRTVSPSHRFFSPLYSSLQHSLLLIPSLPHSSPSSPLSYLFIIPVPHTYTYFFPPQTHIFSSCQPT